ncbi:MAG: PRC-barrel domain-containing protein [Hyphomicrobiaceae bacterium]
MKKTVLALFAAGAVLASVPAIAQQGKGVAIPKGVFLKGQVAGEYLAKDRLIGAKVHNNEGKIVGDIEDLIVGPNNQVTGVIMGVGGFFGAGEKKVGVRLGALQFTVKNGQSVVVLPAATKDVLTALHGYKRAQPKKSLIQRGVEKAKELSDKTTESAKDATATAREKAAPYVEKAKDAAGHAYDKAKEATGAAVEKAKEATEKAKDAIKN